ncbi:centrosomal protein of 55 kDa-like isoform X1 [Paralichthys olivaceus]|uniref:centrosomal protein of 55 kDa-like isoform X1 n=1 Tax=Paralichthys olivaceus TaxID=8255 RepID=UPI00097D6183|nr:PREDICTED: centrosomal protein of 55 kDa-like isoform X1 [Paralichthys olivaceus]
MAASKCKGFPRKKRSSELDVVVSSLRKENAFLKKSLVGLSRQHCDHYKLVERLLNLDTAKLDNSQQLTDKDEKTALPSELSKREDNLTDADFKSDEEASNTRVTELQNQLRDALEWNKQWLDYDQHRVAYVRAIMGKMLWLEKQLNEANLSCSKKHNEDHSDDQKRIGQMQEYYERLLQKAKDELEVLREQVNITQQNLTTTQNWCKEREIELEELKQQLHATELSGQSSPEDQEEDEVKQLADKNKDLRNRLDEEKRRSTNSELQVNLLQKFVLNHQSADQEKIADLERQIQISTQDLEDERQDCSHLKKQLVKVLKLLKKTERQEPKTTELCRDYVTASASTDLLNESSLECPCCKADYPVSHYQELMKHIEVCFE